VDNVKDDAYYLKKLLKDIRFIMEKTEGITVQGFTQLDMLTSFARYVCNARRRKREELFAPCRAGERSQLTPRMKSTHSALMKSLAR